MGKFKGNLAKFKFLANKEWFSPKVPFRRFWEIVSKGQCLWCPIPKKILKHLRVGPHSSRWNSIWNQKEITMKRTTRHQKTPAGKIIYQNEMAFMFCVSKSNQISWCIFHNLFFRRPFRLTAVTFHCWKCIIENNFALSELSRRRCQQLVNG